VPGGFVAGKPRWERESFFRSNVRWRTPFAKGKLKLKKSNFQLMPARAMVQFAELGIREGFRTETRRGRRPTPSPAEKNRGNLTKLR
jgi:hypothetical protein